MAHPAMEASDAPASPGDALEDFADFLEANGAEVDEEQDDDGEPTEGGEPEGDLDPEEEGEPETPAIDPPVSWGNDAKELFSQLPTEMQQEIASREAQREKRIQQATSEAAEARRNARVEAESAFAEQQRQYAAEVEFFAMQNIPQPPDPNLATSDPMAFIQENALYQAALSQHQAMAQRAQQARAEADQRDRDVTAQALQAEMAFLAEQIPDWADPGKRQAFLTDIVNVGVELGYKPESLQNMDGQDILALRNARDWKAKAEKYDALQKQRMEKVRAGRPLPKVVRPGVSPTRAEASATKAQRAWQGVKTARSKDARDDAFADFLEASGHI